MKKIESLKIEGRRWYQRSYGNTYHTAYIVVNGKKLKSPVTYGYGTQYLQTAADLLRESGYEVPENNEGYNLMTSYPHTVEDVKRMKDL